MRAQNPHTLAPTLTPYPQELHPRVPFAVFRKGELGGVLRDLLLVKHVEPLHLRLLVVEHAALLHRRNAAPRRTPRRHILLVAQLLLLLSLVLFHLFAGTLCVCARGWEEGVCVMMCV